MKVVLQRVSQASVSVDQQVVGQIAIGYLLLVGIAHDDTQADLLKMAEKIVKLRLMNDEKGVMNRSILDVQGDILAVSLP
nr:D-aminoacyl-tRNA deacylase [Basilea psittacipulmonis]